MKILQLDKTVAFQVEQDSGGTRVKCIVEKSPGIYKVLFRPSVWNNISVLKKEEHCFWDKIRAEYSPKISSSKVKKGIQQFIKMITRRPEMVDVFCPYIYVSLDFFLRKETPFFTLTNLSHGYSLKKLSSVQLKSERIKLLRVNWPNFGARFCWGSTPGFRLEYRSFLKQNNGLVSVENIKKYAELTSQKYFSTYFSGELWDTLLQHLTYYDVARMTDVGFATLLFSPIGGILAQLIDPNYTQTYEILRAHANNAPLISIHSSIKPTRINKSAILVK